MGSGGDNQTRYYINRTVDGDTLSTALRGLVPGVLYQLEVAAVTSAGVGARSQPLSVLISESTTPTAAGITVSYLNNVRRDCHDILCTHSMSPEDESGGFRNQKSFHFPPQRGNVHRYSKGTEQTKDNNTNSSLTF